MNKRKQSKYAPLTSDQKVQVMRLINGDNKTQTDVAKELDIPIHLLKYEIKLMRQSGVYIHSRVHRVNSQQKIGNASAHQQTPKSHYSKTAYAVLTGAFCLFVLLPLSLDLATTWN